MKELIYDVGMNNGDDTAFYLFQGHRVVAIEADPNMAQRARTRFEREIQQGLLTILNVGIAEAEGILQFWVSDLHPEWNSFDRQVASRNGSPHHAIDVPTAKFSRILREYGKPLYLKGDIEGHDKLCILDLDTNDLPRYISAESECFGECTASHIAADEVLEALYAVGYRSFKLIRQTDFSTLAWPRKPILHLFNDIFSSAAYGKLRMLGIAKIARRFTPAHKLALLNNGYDFKRGSSGPWGEATLGQWMPYAFAREAITAYRRSHFAANPSAPEYSFWCDWHATY